MYKVFFGVGIKITCGDCLNGIGAETTKVGMAEDRWGVY